MADFWTDEFTGGAGNLSTHNPSSGSWAVCQADTIMVNTGQAASSGMPLTRYLAAGGPANLRPDRDIYAVNSAIQCTYNVAQEVYAIDTEIEIPLDTATNITANRWECQGEVWLRCTPYNSLGSPKYMSGVGAYWYLYPNATSGTGWSIDITATGRAGATTVTWTPDQSTTVTYNLGTGNHGPFNKVLRVGVDDSRKIYIYFDDMVTPKWSGTWGGVGDALDYGVASQRMTWGFNFLIQTSFDTNHGITYERFAAGDFTPPAPPEPWWGTNFLTSEIV